MGKSYGTVYITLTKAGLWIRIRMDPDPGRENFSKENGIKLYLVYFNTS